MLIWFLCVALAFAQTTQALFFSCGTYLLDNGNAVACSQNGSTISFIIPPDGSIQTYTTTTIPARVSTSLLLGTPSNDKATTMGSDWVTDSLWVNTQPGYSTVEVLTLCASAMCEGYVLVQHTALPVVPPIVTSPLGLWTVVAVCLSLVVIAFLCVMNFALRMRLELPEVRRLQTDAPLVVVEVLSKT